MISRNEWRKRRRDPNYRTTHRRPDRKRSCAERRRAKMIKRRTTMQDYRDRDKRLLLLGFANYRQYLESPLWSKLRSRVLKRDNHVCWGCGRAATQVHHRRYRKDTLAGTNLEYAVSICRTCHEKIEVRDGKKLTMYAADRSLVRIRRHFNEVQKREAADAARGLVSVEYIWVPREQNTEADELSTRTEMAR